MKLSDEQKISSAFQNARNILSSIESECFYPEWLDDLEFDAQNGEEWITSLKGYFRGLIAAGLIGIENLDDLDSVLRSHGFLE